MSKMFDFDHHAIEDKEVVKVLKQIDTHCVETSNRLHGIEKSIASVVSAFPESDFEGHKRYHQLLIDTLEEKRKLRIAIQEKTISGLIWLGIIGVGTAIWHEIGRLLGR
jgi:hypothetical protein